MIGEQHIKISVKLLIGFTATMMCRRCPRLVTTRYMGIEATPCFRQDANIFDISAGSQDTCDDSLATTVTVDVGRINERYTGIEGSMEVTVR